MGLVNNEKYGKWNGMELVWNYHTGKSMEYGMGYIYPFHTLFPIPFYLRLLSVINYNICGGYYE